MGFKEQAAIDLENLMNSHEISEEVTYTAKRTGNSTTGKAVFAVAGDSNTEWEGGNVLFATLLLPKTLCRFPRPHDSLADSKGRIWYVAAIAGESCSSWTLKLFTEFKVK